MGLKVDDFPPVDALALIFTRYHTKQFYFRSLLHKIISVGLLGQIMTRGAKSHDLLSQLSDSKSCKTVMGCVCVCVLGVQMIKNNIELK